MAIAIIVLIAILIFDPFLIYDLVHMACAGMAMGMLHGPPDAAWVYSDARAWSFFYRAVLAAGFVFLDLFCLRQLISRWNGGLPPDSCHRRPWH